MVRLGAGTFFSQGLYWLYLGRCRETRQGRCRPHIKSQPCAVVGGTKTLGAGFLCPQSNACTVLVDCRADLKVITPARGFFRMKRISGSSLQACPGRLPSHRADGCLRSFYFCYNFKFNFYHPPSRSCSFSFISIYYFHLLFSYIYIPHSY